MRLAHALLLALLLGSCRASATPVAEPADAAAIRAALEELYAAFCFDAGTEPDWGTQRGIFLDGAAFVPPIRADRAPAADDTEQFLADFESLAVGERYRDTGFHERIVGLRVEAFGGVAHAFVAFEGFVPGDGRTVTRGLDSIQLVFDGEAWRLVSFTTQYEDEELTLPARFLDS